MTQGDTAPSIPDADIRAALQKIIASDPFRGQELRSHFLEFIVEEYLAGRSNRIKGTVIALEVYGRGADFDPQSDPIVRVEARKLRRDLELYYLTAGVNESLCIEVPKGGYAPVITKVARPEAPPVLAQISVETDHGETGSPDPSGTGQRQGRTRWFFATLLAFLAVLGASVFLLDRSKTGPQGTRETEAQVSGPTLFVTPFSTSSGTAEEISLARGVTIETTNALVTFDDLKVYPVGADYAFETIDPVVKDVAFILSGRVQLDGGEMRLTTQLLQAKDGLLVWSERYVSEVAPDQIFDIQQGVAESVAKELAEPFALLGRLSQRQLANNSHPSLFSYECVLKGYEYRATFQQDKHGAARDCLEVAVQKDPSYARAWALLAYIYVDENRFFFNQRPGAYGRALAAARTSVELDPTDALSYQALSVALFANGEIEAALSAGQKAVDLNPNNTEALIQMGYRTYATGRWEDGVALVEEAIAASVSPPQWYPWVLALYHFKQQDYEKARSLAEAAGLPNLVLFEATRAAIYGHLGLTDDATNALALVRETDPLFDQRARQWFSVQNFPNDFLDSIMEGLRKAGVQAPD